MNAPHNPGGKVRTALPEGMTGWVKMSECGRYRHALGRSWPADLYTFRGGYVVFVGMNPSTADASVNDPTITREIAFAKRHGFSRLIKVNLGDFRATHPRDLSAPGVVACSPENVSEIQRQAALAGMIVMAHGVPPAPLLDAAKTVTTALRAGGHKLWCFGTTKDGWPRHPLYLPKDALLEGYEGPPNA